MTFVPGRVLGEHHSGRGLEELNRQRSKSRGSSVGDTTQSSEKESDDIEEVDARLDGGLVSGSFGSVRLERAEMALGTVVLLEG